MSEPVIHSSQRSCRIEVVKAAISPLTECQESPRDVFPQEVSHLNGPNFLGVNVLLVIHDAILWDVSRDFSFLRHDEMFVRSVLQHEWSKRTGMNLNKEG